jgi:hypothetical protein
LGTLFKTELPGEWLALSDKDKFLWYAEKYQKEFASSYEKESYFVSNPHDSQVPDIMNYDYAYLHRIERTMREIFGKGEDCGDIELLIRMTASVLLKNKPEDIDVHWLTGEQPEPLTYQHNATIDENKSEKPADFFYPM